MKYMGSKARFANGILEIVLRGRKKEQWYVEPFAGGMNTVCEVSGNRIANDINTYLISMWSALISGWIPQKISKEDYADVRDNKEKYPEYFVGWIGYNCSYSGKWFGGFAGETKTKTGTVRDYQAEAIRNVLRQVDKMHGVTLSNVSYEQLILPAKSIIYCDPPYRGTTKYDTDFDHDLFWDWVRDCGSQGHTVFVSEYSAPIDFSCVWKKETRSSLSANGKSGGSKLSIERLFRYKND